jgi:hypothetical protein
LLTLHTSQNSQSFFQAEKSIVRITQALDATCNVNLQACVSSMAGFARALKLDNNCGQDYKNQNPLVVQAYQGLLAYEPLYRAGCLKATSTGSYCQFLLLEHNLRKYSKELTSSYRFRKRHHQHHFRGR